MASPNDLSLRPPVVAGRFYPGDPVACETAVRQMLQNQPHELPRPCGGMVPHAGWICSGNVAGQVIATLAARPAQIVVVFGAVHTPLALERAALDPHAVWRTPAGESAQPMQVVEKLAAGSCWFVIDERFHRSEHAVEVELPLIQLGWPGALVLPVEVPLIRDAARIGRQTAEQVLATGKSAVFLASSDLTHYGPMYRFAPAGVGEQGLDWARENDRRLLGLIEQYAIEAIVPEVQSRANACGGGAIAAMLAACQVSGAGHAKVLRHTSSYETLAGLAPPDPGNAVGYAGVLVG